MIPVYQTTHGEKGNCFAACMASLFEERLEQWEPTANHYPDWRAQLDKRMAERGMECVEVSLRAVAEPERCMGELTALCLCLRDKGLYMLGVVSTNQYNHVVIGAFDHALTMEKGKLQFHIVHDPLGKEPGAHVTEVSCVLLFSRRFDVRMPWNEVPERVRDNAFTCSVGIHNEDDFEERQDTYVKETPCPDGEYVRSSFAAELEQQLRDARATLIRLESNMVTCGHCASATWPWDMASQSFCINCTLGEQAETK